MTNKQLTDRAFTTSLIAWGTLQKEEYVATSSWTIHSWVRVQLLLSHCLGYIIEGRVRCYFQLNNTHLSGSTITTSSLPGIHYRRKNTLLLPADQNTAEWEWVQLLLPSLPGVHYRRKCKLLLPAEQYIAERECNYYFPNHVGYITEGRVRCYSQLNNTQPCESAIKTSLIARDTLQKE